MLVDRAEDIPLLSRQQIVVGPADDFIRPQREQTLVVPIDKQIPPLEILDPDDGCRMVRHGLQQSLTLTQRALDLLALLYLSPQLLVRGLQFSSAFGDALLE